MFNFVEQFKFEEAAGLDELGEDYIVPSSQSSSSSAPTPSSAPTLSKIGTVFSDGNLSKRSKISGLCFCCLSSLIIFSVALC